jgi:hypothetical protein
MTHTYTLRLIDHDNFTHFEFTDHDICIYTSQPIFRLGILYPSPKELSSRSFLYIPDAPIQSKCCPLLKNPKQCVSCISYADALCYAPNAVLRTTTTFFLQNATIRLAPIHPSNHKSCHRVELEAALSLVLGTTRLTSLLKLGTLGCFNDNSSILGMSSPIRNGFETTSSIPAANSVAICSLRAFAVTAIMGMWHLKSPAFSSSRILLVHCRPSITGISLSMRTTPRSMASDEAFFQ